MPKLMSAIALMILATSFSSLGAEPDIAAKQALSWRVFETGSTASLRGLSALDASTAWATGSGGTVLRTENGGATWNNLEIPGGETLDLRDVEIFDDGGAVLMSAGQPARLYRVEGGDDRVVLAHESPYEAAFFDGVAFWDAERGLAFSDPVEDRFLVLRTEDGGRSWQELLAMPKPVAGEAGFAASGSNLAVGAGGRAWIGTGGSTARILRSTDFGQSWQVADAPMNLEAGTAGIFSLDFRDGMHGVAAGGDYQEPESTERTLSWSADGGATWSLASVSPPSGHRAAVRYVPHGPEPTWISVGRAGSDISTDDGRTWQRFSEVGFYTLSVGVDGSVWAAGSEGRVARLEWAPTAPSAPLPPPGEMARCKQMIDAGLYIAARARLEPIVEQHPGWARATSLLALTYYKENRFEPAKTLFARALVVDPGEVAIRPLYGWTLYSLGELDAAQAMYESLLELEPEYAPAHYALGVIHLDRDEIDSARGRLDRTVELAVQQEDPAMEGRAHARLGDLHVRLDDLAPAKRELELAIELFPDEFNALFKLSRVLQRLGDEEAAADARRRFEEAKARLRPGLTQGPG